MQEVFFIFLYRHIIEVFAYYKLTKGKTVSQIATSTPFSSSDFPFPG
jgi:hypothetical protein